jgi:Protein of unknown function (DUF2442)
MDYHVMEARHVVGHRIWLRFRDGSEGVVDLDGELTGPVFEALRDVDAFKRFRVDEVFHTLVWENGADMAPEFLHSRIHVTA